MTAIGFGCLGLILAGGEDNRAIGLLAAAVSAFAITYCQRAPIWAGLSLGGTLLLGATQASVPYVALMAAPVVSGLTGATGRYVVYGGAVLPLLALGATSAAVAMLSPSDTAQSLIFVALPGLVAVQVRRRQRQRLELERAGHALRIAEADPDTRSKRS